jgi:hypothetical protein
VISPKSSVIVAFLTFSSSLREVISGQLVGRIHRGFKFNLIYNPAGRREYRMSPVHSPVSQSCESLSAILNRGGSDTARRYQAIAGDPKYSHFVRIPDRIVRCIDHLGLAFERETARRRLLAHYLFIGVIDDAIDTGAPHVAETVFDRLCEPPVKLSAEESQADVMVVTDMLRHHITRDTYASVIDSLERAYQEVAQERVANSIETYIAHRKALGRATAEQSYLLIRSTLAAPDGELSRLMQDVGAVGCLVDSLIDLSDDYRAGLLGFRPTTWDFTKLWAEILRAGLQVWLSRPSLTRLFVEALIDNIRDRKGADARDEQDKAIEARERVGRVAQSTSVAPQTELH